MSTFYEYRGPDVFSLSDRSLYQWLEQQEDGLYELPEDSEFEEIESMPKGGSYDYPPT